jgi:hypothetical protein
VEQKPFGIKQLIAKNRRLYFLYVMGNFLRFQRKLKTHIKTINWLVKLEEFFSVLYRVILKTCTRESKEIPLASQAKISRYLKSA